MRYVAALLLFALCWLYTADTRLDPGNGDPYVYLHAAQTLRDGQGLRNYDFHNPIPQAVTGLPNAPMTSWPPLYPIVLAVFGADLQAARILNGLTLGLTLILIWILYADYGVWWGVRLAVMIALPLSLSAEVGRILLSASSETLFYPLMLAYLYALARIKDNRWLAACALLGAALPLTRYVGLAFVGVGALFVFSRRGWGASALYAGAALLPIALWFARNLALTGHLTANTLPGTYTLTAFLIDCVKELLLWSRLTIGLSLMFACLPGVLWLWRRRTARRFS